MKSKYFKSLALMLALMLVVLGLVSCAAEEMTRGEIADMVKTLEDGQVIVSFPGLGIQPFVINRVAFSIPIGENAITVYWYGVLIVIGMALGIVYATFRAKYNEKIKSDDLFDIALWAIVAAIVGARLYYVLTSLDKYKNFWDIFKIWDGGIAIYGALIAGAIAIFFVCKFKKLKFLKVLDLAAPAVMVGQIIGRWGNFINGEAYGYEIAKDEFLYFIRMGIYPHLNEGINAASGSLAYVHPTFLYESIWNLLGFAIINLIYRKKKFDGQIFYAYIAWYGFGRMFIEMLRTDSLYVGAIRISLLVGCLCFVAGVALLIFGAEKGKKEQLAKESYEKQYTNFKTGNPLTSKYEEENEEQKKENEDEDN